MMTTISKKNHRKPPIGGFFVRCYFVIEKIYGVGIIAGAIGVSSNGRTRDFGSLYHGSNPCAPTKNSIGVFAPRLVIVHQGYVAHYREQKYKTLTSSKVKFRKIMSLTTVSNCL